MPSTTGKNYPLSTLEGEGLREKVEETKKGKGLDWDKESENSM
jgi:stalled ribosome alternative rescue factor ArfA